MPCTFNEFHASLMCTDDTRSTHPSRVRDVTGRKGLRKPPPRMNSAVGLWSRLGDADERASRSRDQERRELIGGATKSAPLMIGGGIGSSSGHASRIDSVLAAESIQANSAASKVLKSLRED